MISTMEDEDPAYSAKVVFEKTNGYRFTRRYGPYAAVAPATAAINRLRASHSPKGPNQVPVIRFVSGVVEQSGYVWEPIDRTV